MSKQYGTVIGLRVHVELATKAKIFCGCSAQFGGAPDTHTCPVYTGIPGSLPMLSKQVMGYALAMGLVANCQVNQYYKFDRKDYFYPDNPQNHQISQLCLPVCHDDWVDIEAESDLKKRIGIHGVHVEEDAGKLIHDEWGGCSPMDYNRSGVPLIEIVSEPDVRSAEEVIAYLEKLRLIIQYLGASDCELQEGPVRADVNLSVREAGAVEFGTRTRMKNLSSFKTIARAIEGERRRQIELLEDGRKMIQKARRWDNNKENSKAIRSKEDAQDYRYFPDPDLIPVVIDGEWIARVKTHQPELRTEEIAKYMEKYGLSEYDVRFLISSKHMTDIFEETTHLGGQPKEISNWLMVEAMRLMEEQEMEPEDMGLSPTRLAAFIGMVEKNTVNRMVAKTVFEEIFEHDAGPGACMKEKDLKVIRDGSALRRTVEAVMAVNPQSVEDYRSDKEKAMGFLMEQAMKAMKGKANPAMVNRLVKELLDGGDTQAVIETDGK